MGKPIITVEGLGKKYLLTHLSREPYTALRDVMSEGAKRVARNLSRRLSSLRSEVSTPSIEEFWALRDVSFEVNEGDRIGIIGRNGAGKTTLLKILSRITEPTEGRIRLRGRVASLLEVGTGFHPELTGRENIFLNGAILGMTKAEIEKKFDEIVDFAEVERFLDTPVKRYSSGMYVRLAFAVAAHLEPEILIIDEVLAVGDAQFQKKCIGKMDQAGKEGRTVLFVSHNMNAVEQFCTRCLLLDRGIVRKYSNEVRSVIKEYLAKMEDQATEWINPGNQYNNHWFKPLRIYLSDDRSMRLAMPVRNDSEIWVNIEAEVKHADPAITFGYAIYTEDEFLLYWSYQTDMREEEWPKLSEGIIKIKSKLPKRLFNEGTYKIELISSLHFREWLNEPGKNAPSIFLTIQGGLSDSPYWIAKRPGLLAPVIPWKVPDSGEQQQ
jgi:lipopolysaccharide transport system ATP-binding protein